MYFLEGPRIGLRPLTRSDCMGNYGDWLNDDMVCKCNGHHRYPCSVKSLEEYVDMIDSTPSMLVLAIEEKNTKIHIGNISLQGIDSVSQCGEFAIIIGEQNFWNQGVAKEAGALLIAHGFQEINLNRIYLGTLDCNQGMHRLALALGFTQEGIRRQALYKHGEFHDIIEYGLLKSEWIIGTKMDRE